MKKILFPVVILCIGFLAFISSCVKDTFTEKDAYSAQQDLITLQDSLQRSQELLRDSLKNIGGVINYSVAAVLASDASWLSHGSSKGGQQLDQVAVTISQYGKLITVTTDASGIASFKDLRIGTVNVNVKKTGYTEVDFIAVLPALPDSSHVAAYSIVRHVGTMVPVFSLTDNLATVTGIATVETDLTNDTPEVAANVDIIGTIDVDNYEFSSRYIHFKETDVSNGAWTFDYYGVIKQIAFHSTISKTTTAADGSFSLKVPSTPTGLPIKLMASEFAATQKLLQPTLNNIPVWGVQSVRTLFGPYDDGFYYSSIPQIGTWAPFTVQSAYVQFSAPTGTPAAQPTSTASATAVLSSSGIASVNITFPGEGYTQAPKVRFAPGSAFNSIQAEGTAVIANGRVTNVQIDKPGSGYKPSDLPDVTFTEGVEQTAVYEPEFAFSIVNIDINNWGSGYSQTAPAVTIFGSGTGATAHAVMSAYLKTITVTTPGSGYTQAPQISISDNFKAWDEAIPLMTSNNPLFSIAYKGTNNTLWPVSPLPTATVIGDGAGATASVTLSTVGKVVYFAALNRGSGYTSTPVLTISGGGGGFGATAHATLRVSPLGGFEIDTIIIDDPGQGYVSIPTFTFSGGGGIGASATPVLGFPIQSITMTAPGNGYNEGNMVAINVSNGTITENYIDDCVVKYNMGLRDIDNFSPNGWYYSGVPTITIRSKDGNGAGAAATGGIQWEINDIVVDNQGSGYKYDNENNVYIRIAAPAGTGVQATATAVLGNGKLSAVGPVWLGEGYTAVPNAYVTVSEGVSPIKQAKLTPIVAGGHVTGLTITDPGEGYDFDSYNSGAYDIKITTFNTAAAASAQANPQSGQIDYIQIDDPGAGYSVIPTVEVINSSNSGEVNGFGKGLAATATLTDGRVSAINITNHGSGYYEVPAIKITVPFSQATAVGMCDVDEYGRITGVSFPYWGGSPYVFYTQGHGYIAAPTVTFFPSVPGKGTGAAGVAVIEDGSVVDVIMTNQGSGYTGKNNPASTTEFTVTPDGTSILATAGKTYIRDVNFGTGKRMTNEDYSWFGDK
jgi:hypothetical protein